MWWNKTVVSKITKAKLVEQALRKAGKQGISNWDLNKLSFRYSAFIFDLRNKGHEIDSVKIGKDGLYKYYWRSK